MANTLILDNIYQMHGSAIQVVKVVAVIIMMMTKLKDFSYWKEG